MSKGLYLFDNAVNLSDIRGIATTERHKMFISRSVSAFDTRNDFIEAAWDATFDIHNDFIEAAWDAAFADAAWSDGFAMFCGF